MLVRGFLAVFALSSAAIVLSGCAGTDDVVYAGGAAPTRAAQHETFDDTGGNTAIVIKPAPDQPKVNAATKASFEAVEAVVEKQMEPGGRWQFLTPGQRHKVDGDFAAMQALFDRYGSVARMNVKAKARLLVDQSDINAILTRTDGKRLICQQRVNVGSHLPAETCEPYAEIEIHELRTQQSLERTMQENDVGPLHQFLQNQSSNRPG